MPSADFSTVFSIRFQMPSFNTMPQDLQPRCGVLIGQDCPAPIIDHAQARAQTLALYKKTLP